MKKILFGLLCLFCFSLNVKALYNSDFGTYIDTSGSFYNLGTTTSNSEYAGYNIITSSIGDFTYYSSHPTTNFTLINAGGILIQCNQSIISGHNYSLTYVFMGDVSSQPYVHPMYSNWANKIGIGTTPTGFSYFNMQPYSSANSTQSTVTGYWYYETLQSVHTFSVVFKANSSGSCVGSVYNASNHDEYASNYAFMGYKIEDLGVDNLSSSDVQNALSSSFSSVIDSVTSSSVSIINNSNSNTNSIIDNNNANTNTIIENNNSNTNTILQNADENSQNEINNANSNSQAEIENANANSQAEIENANQNAQNIQDNLNENFNNCRDSYNLFNINGFEAYPEDANGSIYNNNTTKLSDTEVKFRYHGGTPYGIKLDTKSNRQVTLSGEYTCAMTLQYAIVGYNKNTGLTFYWVNWTDISDGHINGSKLDYTIDLPSYNNSYDFYLVFRSKSNGSDGVTFNNFQVQYGGVATEYEEYGSTICTNRIDDTNDKLDEANETSKGIWQTLKDLPGVLIEKFTDMLKSLFIPDSDQLYEIIQDASELSENFGFIGQSMEFFISIFTTLLGLVNHDGCIELPEFTIGATSLFDSHTFWNAQNVCLSDNAILSDNIDTIRLFTDIVLVAMFVSWAASKFFSILSKNGEEDVVDYSDRDSAVPTVTHYRRVNGTVYKE